MSTNLTRALKVLSAATILATAIASPSLALTPRERAIQQCNALDKQQNHDPHSSSGGPQYHYRACMADHGQPS